MKQLRYPVLPSRSGYTFVLSLACSLEIMSPSIRTAFLARRLMLCLVLDLASRESEPFCQDL